MPNHQTRPFSRTYWAVITVSLLLQTLQSRINQADQMYREFRSGLGYGHGQAETDHPTLQLVR